MSKPKTKAAPKKGKPKPEPEIAYPGLPEWPPAVGTTLYQVIDPMHDGPAAIELREYVVKAAYKDSVRLARAGVAGATGRWSQNRVTRDSLVGGGYRTSIADAKLAHMAHVYRALIMVKHDLERAAHRFAGVSNAVENIGAAVQAIPGGDLNVPASLNLAMALSQKFDRPKCACGKCE